MENNKRIDSIESNTMSADFDEAFLFDQTSCDLAQHIEAFDGWQVNYAQMKPGRFTGRSREVRLEGMQLFLEGSSVQLNEYGSAWPNSYVFAVPVQMDGNALFNGMPWYADTLVAFRGEKQHDAIVPPGYQLILAIDRKVFQDYYWALEFTTMEGWLSNGPLFVRDQTLTGHFSSQLLNTLAGCFREPEVLNHAQNRNGLLQQTLECVASLVSANQNPPRPVFSAFSRTDVVRRAREYIIEHIDTPIHMLEICSALNVSRRTLQYSFSDVLGVSPATYLRVLRLNGARRQLLSRLSGPRLQIKDVVARWGFWHLSRFSAAYRQLFGELPSDTLKASRYPELEQRVSISEKRPYLQ